MKKTVVSLLMAGLLLVGVPALVRRKGICPIPSGRLSSRNRAAPAGTLIQRPS